MAKAHIEMTDEELELLGSSEAATRFQILELHAMFTREAQVTTTLQDGSSVQRTMRRGELDGIILSEVQQVRSQEMVLHETVTDLWAATQKANREYAEEAAAREAVAKAERKQYADALAARMDFHASAADRKSTWGLVLAGVAAIASVGGWIVAVRAGQAAQSTPPPWVHEPVHHETAPTPPPAASTSPPPDPALLAELRGVREDMGALRRKVDATGHALLDLRDRPPAMPMMQYASAYAPPPAPVPAPLPEAPF